MTTFHTLAFADPDGHAWGIHWLADEQASAPLACRVGGGIGTLPAALAGTLPATVEGTDQTAPWRLEGDRVSLLFTPSGAPARGGASQAGIDSVDQLCTVSGRVVLDGAEREIDCHGWRAVAEGAIDLAEIDTFRQTCGWFSLTDGLSLLALRRRKSRGHDTDLISAAVLEDELAPRVEDPRLSSTYGPAGVPTRVGLELWFQSDGSPDEPDEDEERQIPRRAAGEAIGEAIEWKSCGFTLQGVPLRWHSRGSDGSGVYLLGRRA
jgi:hypothetical protein